MINFIKYSDKKICEADAKMKAVRNMKENIDKLKKEKDVILNTINKKLLDRNHRETEMKTVWVLTIFNVIFIYIFCNLFVSDSYLMKLKLAGQN